MQARDSCTFYVCWHKLYTKLTTTGYKKALQENTKKYYGAAVKERGTTAQPCTRVCIAHYCTAQLMTKSSTTDFWHRLSTWLQQGEGHKNQPHPFLPWPSWPAPAALAPSSPSLGLAAHEPPGFSSQLHNAYRLSARTTVAVGLPGPLTHFCAIAQLSCGEHFAPCDGCT